jgi:hypothetical protein
MVTSTFLQLPRRQDGLEANHSRSFRYFGGISQVIPDGGHIFLDVTIPKEMMEGKTALNAIAVYEFQASRGAEAKTVYEDEKLCWRDDMETELSRNGRERWTAIPTGLGL